ncbi:MAG TPA: TonB-dependent receptor [Myxococcaceae bacterium]|nr:TonB-dependent receptor [Myxococcaceae bacterium]
MTRFAALAWAICCLASAGEEASAPPPPAPAPEAAPAPAPAAPTPAPAPTTTADNTIAADTPGEEIVVVGSRFTEKRLESPVTVEVVKPQEVQMMGSSSYLAALSQVKGVDYTDNGVGEKRISARGFNTQFNSRMLFMVDGRLATLPGNGLPQGALLPTASLDIKSVEVVLGPAAALYGPNAHSGVVNVVTKSPWDQSGVDMAFRAGSQLLFDGSARVAGTVNNTFGYKLTAQLSRANDWAPDTTQRAFFYGPAASPVFEGDLIGNQYNVFSGKVEGFGYYRAGDWNVKAGAGWSINDGFSATNTGRNHLRGWQVQFQTVQASSSNWYAQFTRTASDAGRTYQLDRIAGLVAAANLAGTRADQAQIDAWKDQFKFIDKSSLYDAEVQYKNEFGALRVVAGAGGRLYQPVSEGTYLADVNGAKLSAVEGGLYAQAEYDLFDKIKAVAALRTDGHSNYSLQLSPKGALVYTVAPGHNVRATYNRAFKSPTILENYLLINNTFLGNKTGFVIKDASGNELSEIAPLSPEQVDSVEVGYKGSFDRLYLDVVGYHSWYHNFISALTSRANGTTRVAYYADTGAPTAEGTAQQGQLLTYSNFGAAQVLGTDVGMDYQILPEVGLNASVSFIRMYSFQNNDPTLTNLLLNVPQLKGRLGVTLQDLGIRNSFLRLATRYQSAYKFASGRWVSSAFFPDGLIPQRFVADLGVGYKFDNGIQISANAYNLTNDHGVDVMGAPASGVFFFGQVEYTFNGLNN